MPLFDSYVIVDWSAAARPTPERESPNAIWWAAARRHAKAVEPRYVRTRAEAIVQLTDFIGKEQDRGRRVLAGFDFPFGYPAGVAGAVTGRDSAMCLWRWIADPDRSKDSPRNANNRFEVAEEINAKYSGVVGPFWGLPNSTDFTHKFGSIPIRRSKRTCIEPNPPEFRIAEQRANGAKSVWQLWGAGAVGSQVLVGLPALLKLLRATNGTVDTGRRRAQVWPLETGLTAPVTANVPVVLAEVYPSLFKDMVSELQREGEIVDSAQVRVLAQHFADLDGQNRLAPLFAGPRDLDARQRRAVENEEAWILGLDDGQARYGRGWQNGGTYRDWVADKRTVGPSRFGGQAVARARLWKRVPDRAAPPAGLFGRNRELRALGGMLELVSVADRRDFAGCTQVITGAPGAGKSALLGELQALWNDRAAVIELEPHTFSDPDYALRRLARSLVSELGRLARARIRLNARLRGVNFLGVKVDVAPSGPELPLRALADLRAALPDEAADIPIAVFVDEAQTLAHDMEAGNASKQSSLLMDLHSGTHGLRILPVFSGLNHTVEHLAALGVSRLGANSVHVLGCLSPDETTANLQTALQILGVEGHPAAERWLNESVERSCGWPQHITSYIKGLALALLPDDDAESLRALTRDACREAISQGESGRQEYYGARLAPFRDIAPALKAVVAAIREARSKGRPGVDWTTIRKSIRESAEDMQSQGMVWTIDLAAVPDMLVRHGILQQSPEADGCWNVPIPSLADRILAKRF